MLISSLMTRLPDTALHTDIYGPWFSEIYFRATRFCVGTAYLSLYAALCGIGSHFVTVDCESRTHAAQRDV